MPDAPADDVVDVHTAHDRAAAGALTIVDVREDDEYAAGHSEGALHIKLGDLPDALDALPEGLVAFSCQSGKRSAKAQQIAKDAGRTDVLNVEGGFKAWSEAELPVSTGTDA